MGTEAITTVTKDITITETVHSATQSPGAVTIAPPTLLSGTPSTALAGGSAAWQLDITVPAGITFGLDITGDSIYKIWTFSVE